MLLKSATKRTDGRAEIIKAIAVLTAAINGARSFLNETVSSSSDLRDGRMTFQFYGYEVRSARLADDYALAEAWVTSGDSRFFLRQEPGRESFIVLYRRAPIAFYQVEHVGKAIGGCIRRRDEMDIPINDPITDQARIHFQANPAASRKILLRGITMLVPLIEKALTLRGVKAVFFTSHSPAMATFMQKRMGYRPAGDGVADGVMMAKGL
jgi:hypothetical protein